MKRGGWFRQWLRWLTTAMLPNLRSYSRVKAMGYGMHKANIHSGRLDRGQQ